MSNDEEIQEKAAPDAGVLMAISRAEIDTQITTARAYPRSVRSFLTEALDMVTLTEDIAASCIYAVPRKENGRTKMIEGPSARFAEMIAHAWGNCRAGARVVAEEAEFVVAQGVFHDLEKNTCITYEVKRRITGKSGRYGADMIAVTGNAACSIALRNAVLKGVPKSFWNTLYDEARRAAVGNTQTLANKRSAMLGYFQKMGATEDMVLAQLGLKGVEDIGLDELAALKGLATAIKEGEITIEQAFSAEKPERPGVADLTDRLKRRAKGEPEPAKAPLVTLEGLLLQIQSAADADELAEAADLIRELDSEQDKAAAGEAYKAAVSRLSGE